MSAIINFNLDVSKLPKEKFVAGKNGSVYVNLTMAVNDETRYGNNTSVYVSQTSEEREVKKKKTFIGNGRVVWNNGEITNAEREDEAQKVPQKKEVADLPF
jgi:hypothetical protein